MKMKLIINIELGIFFISVRCKNWLKIYTLKYLEKFLKKIFAQDLHRKAQNVTVAYLNDRFLIVLRLAKFAKLLLWSTSPF